MPRRGQFDGAARGEIDAVDHARAAGGDIAHQREHGLAAFGDGARIVAAGEMDGILRAAGYPDRKPRPAGRCRGRSRRYLRSKVKAIWVGRGGCLQGGDLRIVGAVEDQHLVGILGHDVEAVAHGVGQQVGQRSRGC